MDTAHTIKHLESLIAQDIAEITELNDTLRLHRDTLKGTIEQDKEYTVIHEEVKKHKKKTQEVKQKLMKTDAIIGVKYKLDDITKKLKEAKKSLSENLNNYVSITQATEFIMPDGTPQKIVRTARLAKQSRQS